MAEEWVDLALTGAGPVIQNYDKAWDPVKNKAQRMRERRKSHRQRGRGGDNEPTPEERGWVLKKRSEVQSDEEIVDRAPRNQQMVPYRPRINRRASSLDRDGFVDRRDRPGDRRVGTYRGRHDHSDSEGSVPPRSRVSNARSRRSSSKSTSDSEDLGSSTEDERRCRDVKRKRWLSGGLAAVATVHAAAKIYSSLEARDKRHQAVLSGELSPEKAKQQRNRGRWQDAAAVGVAAVGIRGCVGEWHEVEEKQDQYKKLVKEREERHQKRMEKQRRLWEANRNGGGSGYGGGRGRDDDYRQRAIKDHGEYDKPRSKSMGAHDDDGDSRALVRSKSRRRYDD